MRLGTEIDRGAVDDRAKGPLTYIEADGCDARMRKKVKGQASKG